MERLCGHALSDYLTDRVVLEPDEVVDLVRQVGRGLSAAHGAGIIHRDLKPRNLFRLSRPEADVRWKILDFGTCKCVDEEATLTDDGHVLGTPAYMAPEQARGARVDFRADLYSLGVIAYRTLTGRPPFDNREVTGLLYDVVYSMPPQPTMLRTMHRDVDRVFAIALAKHPYERLDCAEALATALESAFRGELSADLRARGDALMAAFPFCGVTPPTVH
jgi:serine/threonine-protein kinase